MDLPQKRKKKPTVSIAVPDSIVTNAQSPELRAYLVSQIARSAAIFSVDEIVVIKDSKDAGKLNPTSYFIRNLEYLETPQYLRKKLFPMHPDLRLTGLMNPLDTPHHLRETQDSQFREGVVLDRPVKKGKGSWADIGLRHDIEIDYKLTPGTRVTVKVIKEGKSKNYLEIRGEVVSPDKPKKKLGVYWGYRTRIANHFHQIFTDAPYEGGYDLVIGTSDRGQDVQQTDLPNCKHCLVVFGGLSGIEDLLESDETLSSKNLMDFFHYYLNTCPSQGTRTIRTEEAMLISLSTIIPKIN